MKVLFIASNLKTKLLEDFGGFRKLPESVNLPLFPSKSLKIDGSENRKSTLKNTNYRLQRFVHKSGALSIYVEYGCDPEKSRYYLEHLVNEALDDDFIVDDYQFVISDDGDYSRDTHDICHPTHRFVGLYCNQVPFYSVKPSIRHYDSFDDDIHRIAKEHYRVIRHIKSML